MLVDKSQGISCEGLVAILMNEPSNVVLDIFGGFMFSKIKLNHGSKLVTKLHQSHAALELANLKMSHEIRQEFSKSFEVDVMDTFRSIEYNKDV